MTDSVELPHDAFFGPASFRGPVSGLFLKAAAQRGAVKLEFDDARAVISAEPCGAEDAPLRCTGRWRTPDVDSTATACPGARMLLPLLFRFTAIRLPHSELAEIGPADRCAADVIVRSLLLAALRGTAFDWQAGRAGPANPAARDLARRCIYALATILPDPALNGPGADDLLDLLVADLYLPVLRFANPVLRAGADTLRRARLAGPSRLAELQSELESLRTAQLAPAAGR